jgi:hypothetical protein
VSISESIIEYLTKLYVPPTSRSINAYVSSAMNGGRPNTIWENMTLYIARGFLGQANLTTINPGFGGGSNQTISGSKGYTENAWPSLSGEIVIGTVAVPKSIFATATLLFGAVMGYALLRNLTGIMLGLTTLTGLMWLSGALDSWVFVLVLVSTIIYVGFRLIGGGKR